MVSRGDAAYRVTMINNINHTALTQGFTTRRNAERCWQGILKNPYVHYAVFVGPEGEINRLIPLTTPKLLDRVLTQ